MARMMGGSCQGTNDVPDGQAALGNCGELSGDLANVAAVSLHASAVDGTVPAGERIRATKLGRLLTRLSGLCIRTSEPLLRTSDPPPGTWSQMQGASQGADVLARAIGQTGP